MVWDRDIVAVDQMALRRHNLGLVLRHLREHGPRSRARIAAETGLNKATVSSLVTDLTGRGLVQDGPLERGAVGRPGHAVELDGAAVCGLGAEINVDSLAVLALNLRDEVVGRRRRSLDTRSLQPDEVLDHLAAMIAETTDEVSALGAQVVGLTLGVAGLVDTARGLLEIGPNLDWRGVPVAALMQERLGRPAYPVQVENEANLAAIAEASGLGDPERRDLIVLAGEVGIGGGIVSGGHLLRGGLGFAGEVGHIRVDPEGRKCGCGRTGCWETRVGLRALLLEAAGPGDPLHDPALRVEDRLAELDRRAELGDGRTLAALHQVGHWLGTGIATLANVLNPSLVVLSGYLGVAGRWMLADLEAELAAETVAPHAGGCRVVLSALGSDAAVRGGAQVALETVFTDPTAVRGSAAAPTRLVGGTR